MPLLAEARYKSRFLFGPEIEGQFDEIWKRAVDMRTLRDKLHGPSSLPVGAERTEVCEKESVLMKWMLNEMRESPKRYAKYLAFH